LAKAALEMARWPCKWPQKQVNESRPNDQLTEEIHLLFWEGGKAEENKLPGSDLR